MIGIRVVVRASVRTQVLAVVRLKSKDLENLAPILKTNLSRIPFRKRGWKSRSDCFSFLILKFIIYWLF